MRGAYEAIFRQTGKMVAPPETDLPACVEHVWDWYIELQGVESLTNLEIFAWSSIHGIVMRPWEIKLLKKLHDRARAWWQERSKRENS